jgi:hypothetical protein
LQAEKLVDDGESSYDSAILRLGKFLESGKFDLYGRSGITQECVTGIGARKGCELQLIVIGVEYRSMRP